MSEGVTDRRFVITARVTLYTRVLFVGVVTALLVRMVEYVAGNGAGGARWTAVVLIAGYLVWLAAEVRVTFSRPAEPVTEVRTILAYATSWMLVTDGNAGTGTPVTSRSGSSASNRTVRSRCCARPMTSP